MSKVLIFSAFSDISALECAVTEVNSGNEVHVIHCDKQMRVCMHNLYGNQTLCNLCHHSMMNAWKESGIYNKITMKSFSDLLTSNDEKNASNFKIDFNSVKDLKGMKYKG